MEKLKTTPFFKLVLFLITGIVTSSYFDVTFNFYLFLPILIFTFLYFSTSNKNVFVKSIFIYFIIFFVGIIITTFKNDKIKIVDYKLLKSYTAVTTEVSEVKGFKKAVVKLLNTDCYGYLFFSNHFDIKVNDTILFSNVLKPIKQSSNIGGFNFYNYCNYHDIYFSNFLTKDFTINKCTNQSIVEHLKSWLNSSLNIFYKSNEVNTVVKALLLGNKQSLEKEIKQIFTNVGGMHVLAVSGLHVGLLVLFFNFIFKPLRYYKYGKVFHFLLLIFILVFFSFLVGNSSSVVRSVFMFLLFTSSSLLQKKNNSLNALFFCGFVLLVTNPYYLFDVGFQLSFLAVLGILIFYPILEKLYLPKNLFLKFLWQLNLISIAAQIFTFPLVILYFHQFTFLFFISNYITYLLALILVLGTICVLIISLFSVEISLFVSELVIAPVSVLLLKSLKIISSYDILVIKNIFSDNVIVILFFIISVTITSLFLKFSKLKIYSLCFFFVLLICYYQHLNYRLLKEINTGFYSYDSSKLSFTINKGVEAFHFYEDSTSFTLFNDFDRENKVISSKYFNVSVFKNNYLEFDDFVLCFNNEFFKTVKSVNSDKLIYFIQNKLTQKKLAELNKLTRPVILFLNNNSYSNLIDNSNVKIIKN